MQAIMTTQPQQQVKMMARIALSASELQSKCPSVYAKRQSSKLGDNYTFIPSSTIVEALAKMGMVPVEASQRRSQESTTARHLVRFARKVDLVKARKVGEYMPELVLSNSHNGRAAFKLFSGLFRFVCGNELIVADKSFGSLVRRHTGDVQTVYDEAEKVLAHTGEVVKHVDGMIATLLTEAQRNAFAMEALRLRYANSETGKLVAPVTAQALLVARRPQDDKHDLWHTFNNVQENLLRGGLDGKSAAGRVIRTREVHDVRKVLAFNTSLWSLASAQIG